MKDKIDKIAELLKEVGSECASSRVAKSSEGLPYVVIRGDRSGAFAGFLKSRKDREVTLVNARRLYYWDGAASLSQLAEEGVSKPGNCKFPKPVAEIIILDAIEVMSASESARKSIEGVKIWSA